MLKLVASNRMESLVRALQASLDAAPPGSPLASTPVLVPSLGVARALGLSLATRHGVAMGFEFAFLAQWLWRTMARVLPGIAAETPFDAATLAWRIHTLLASPAVASGHGRLSAYLDAVDEPARFDLAQRIAALFEHYTTYRADWLERWREGGSIALPDTLDATAMRHARDDEAWQRALWQALLAGLALTDDDPARRFTQQLRDAPERVRALLPPTLHVVALPAIAPQHRTLLRALADVIDVHVYALDPSRAYWFDVVDEKLLARWRAARNPRAIHAESGHPLLAAWGRQTQTQLEGLMHALHDEESIDDAFVEPERDSRLARLQRAILDLDDAPRAVADHDAHDDSVEVHACHGLRRQLEALHDRLLALFAQPDAPRAHEVLVVTPELDAAAPMIDAVFGAASGREHIAYAITGRQRGDDGGVAAALLALVDAGTSRLTATTLLALVDTPLVAKRRRWSSDDTALIRDWLDEAGMRWALGAEHRAQAGLPATREHTLDAALDRLLLGHLTPDAPEASSASALPPLFAHTLPAGRATGAQADVLGALAAFADDLDTWRVELAQPHPVARWHRLLVEALDRFFAPMAPAEHDGLRQLRLTLARWQAQARAAEHTRAIPAPVMRASLAQALEARAAGAVPGGAVTFASMTSLRGLPYRVVVALGLDDGAWGRGVAPPEFDLMALAPRAGDRQRRLDERNVFLDLLLAARERFWVFHTGRGVRDNAPLPPAVVVDELLDELARAEARPRADLDAAVRVDHPLQPFAVELFAPDAPPRRRSHRHAYALALQAHATPPAPATEGDAPQRAFTFDSDDDTDGMDDADAGTDDDALADARRAAPFFTRDLAPPDEAQRDLTLDDLKRFFANPARYLLQDRLGLALRRDERALRDDEPFDVDPLDRSALARRLVPALRDGAAAASLRDHARASGLFPHGAVAEPLIDDELALLARMAAALPAAPATLDAATPTLRFDVDGVAWSLTLRLPALRPEGHVTWRAAKVKPKHRLEAWIDHLALHLAAPPQVARHTRLVLRDAVVTFAPLDAGDAARALFAELVQIVARGLVAPLPFMPSTSWAATDEKPMAAIQAAWSGNRQSFNGAASGGPGEAADAWVALAWRGHAPLIEHDDFAALAQRVFAPLRSGMQEQPT